MPRSVRIDRPQPSYKQGFARSAGESAYPNLWPRHLALSPGLGPTGGTLHDLSGQGRDGTLTSMDLSTGWEVSDRRYSIKPDGVNDHVLISDFSYGPNFTISFWFKVEDLVGADFQYMFSHDAFSVQNSVNIFLYEESQANHPRLRTVLVDSDDATDAGAQSALDIDINYEDGLWHLYTLTVGSFGSRVYVDGVEKITSAAQGGDSFNPTTDIFWGGREDLDAGRFFPGNLDELFLYDRDLNASEHTQLYIIGRGGIFQRRPITIAKAPAVAGGTILPQIVTAYHRINA